MNKKEIRETAENIVAGKERHYWDGRQAEAEERESNGISKRQNKLLKDSDEWERNVKRKYGELLRKYEEPIKAKHIQAEQKEHLNHTRKHYLTSEITEEMREKEEQYNIDYVDYIMDNK